MIGKGFGPVTETNAQPEAISTTPSVAIRQAVADIERAEASERFTVVMSNWVSRYNDEGDPISYLGGDSISVCGVCMGGSMLTRQMTDHHLMNNPVSPVSAYDDGYITKDQQDVIEAMDNIRQEESEEVERGLIDMGVYTGVAKVVAYEYSLWTTYEEDPDTFKRERLQLAKRLEGEGY